MRDDGECDVVASGCDESMHGTFEWVDVGHQQPVLVARGAEESERQLTVRILHV